MKRLFFLCFLMTVFGCEKESNDIINYPSTLVATDFQVVSDVKLFTRKGQINNSKAVKRYIEKNTSDIFYPNNTSYIPIPKTDTIIYQSKDTVMFSVPGDWGKRLPKSVGDYVYFCMTDTLVGFKTLQQQGPLSEIINQIGLFKPYYEEVAIGANYHRVLDAYMAKGNADKLEFPYMTYRITRRRNNTYSNALIKNYNNVFDPNVVRLLEEGDTLAIQEARLIYIKLNK